MKKFAALPPAALMIAALVAGPMTEAATAAGPYPGTVPTHTHAVLRNNPAVHHGHNKKYASARIHYWVTAAGSATPRGHIVVKWFKHGQFVHSKTRPYNGPATHRFGHLTKGKYRFVVKFKPRAGSVWKPSKTSLSVKVAK